MLKANLCKISYIPVFSLYAVLWVRFACILTVMLPAQ